MMIRLVSTWMCTASTCRLARPHGFIPPATATCRIISRRVLTTAAVSKVHTDEKSILVNWNDRKDSWSKFHFDWLRDNCPCTKCTHPDYDQRLLTTLEDPAPASVNVEGSEAVEVKWRDGHHSQYPYSWLLAKSYCHDNVTKPATGSMRKVTLWGNNSQVTANPPEINYNEIMADDKKLLTLLKNMYEYGFCFILDTPPIKESMMEAALRIGPLQDSCYGQLWLMEVGVKLTVEHVSYTTKRIMPHTDSPALYDSPGTTWAHVIESKDVEGATSILIDGFKVAEHIRKNEPEYFTLLNKVSLPYELIFNKGKDDEAVYRARRHTFTVDDDNEMTGLQLNNIDRKPLDEISLSEAREALSCDADEAITKMYQALRYLHNLLLCDDNQFAYKFDLQPGKMMVLNNHRMLHARTDLLRGYRILCGAHHSESEWLSKLEVLEQRFN